MSEKVIRIASVARELNLGISTIAEHLNGKGFDIDAKPTSKLTEEMYNLLLQDFRQEKEMKDEATQINLGGQPKEERSIQSSTPSTQAKKKKEQEEVLIKNLGTHTTEGEEEEVEKKETEKLDGPTVIGKIDLEGVNQKTRPSKKEKEEKPEEEKEKPVAEEKAKEEKPEKKKQKEEEPEETIENQDVEKLKGTTVIGKIDLPEKKTRQPVASSSFAPGDKKKRKRKIFVKSEDGKKVDATKKQDRHRGKAGQQEVKEVSEKEVEEKLKATLAKLDGGKGKSAKAKYKRLKKENAEGEEVEDTDKNEIQVTEFISVKDLASLLDVAYTEIISACMKLGIIVSINQRLDAETIEIVADEFGSSVKFIGADEEEEEVETVEDAPEDLVPRPPVVTIMGHVDHGKTSLLDYIRKANVIAGEAGGITQHIGAYEVTLDDGRQIAFLDTPGHEAFTAMRARGAQVTDVAVIIVAADDDVMPQTKEAISHAQAAGVPMVFAINKIDKDGANPDKIREQLANMDILVEEWGGKYQCQEISAKGGTNIEELLEKVLLEAELLELKANPNRDAEGTIIEASLDKGRGYVASFLVERGTLRVGDFVLSGKYYGKIKAMYNERAEKVKTAGPSTPIQVLGLNGAPQAGDKFKVMDSEQEAKQIANKRDQIAREQGIRTKKHITLDEIGRRIALGNFKELNLVIKGDVDGSIEALSDSLQKLSIEEIAVNVIHKSVGPISESDVLLASASDAIIIGFQVRPSLTARSLAEKEEVEIRLYSVIYDAIDHIKAAMEGMLDARIEEKIIGNIEVRETFKISKVGTIAGCFVVDGKVKRDTKIRVIREGVVAYTGELESLKRFKDDVKEVAASMECGLNIKNYNDIKVGDIIEGYEEVEIKRTLKEATASS